eukprot:768463-Hanusia_phi.AAC.3
MSGVGIVWRVAHSKGIPNDILVCCICGDRISISLHGNRWWIRSILKVAQQRPIFVLETFFFKWMGKKCVSSRHFSRLSHQDFDQVIGMPVTSIAEKLFGPVGTQERFEMNDSYEASDLSR